MTFSGWLSLGTEILIIGVVLGGLARLGGVVYRLIRAEVRTWRIQQEIADMQWPTNTVRERMVHKRPVLLTTDDLMTPELKRYAEGHARLVGAACGVSEKDMDFITRRNQLDGLATASDKAERRIVH